MVETTGKDKVLIVDDKNEEKTGKVNIEET